MAGVALGDRSFTLTDADGDPILLQTDCTNCDRVCAAGAVLSLVNSWNEVDEDTGDCYFGSSDSSVPLYSASEANDLANPDKRNAEGILVLGPIDADFTQEAALKAMADSLGRIQTEHGCLIKAAVSESM